MTSSPAPVPSSGDAGLSHRVSDAEREQTAEVLREAAGDGRLTIVELEERLDQAYGARTYGELVQVTHDLPGATPRPADDHRTVAAGSAAPAQFGQLSAVLGEVKRHGAWRPPEHLVVRTVLGETKLDFTEAELPSMEIRLDINVLLGEAKIRVPEDAVVHLDGAPILGEVSEERSRWNDKWNDRWDKWWNRGSEPPPEPRPVRDGPVFHINARAILGEIKVHRGPSRWRRLTER